MASAPDYSFTVSSSPSGFEQITSIVSSEFRVQEIANENGIPTYYLAPGQETKQAFLRLLKKLQPLNMMGLLRRIGGRPVLKVVLKSTAKPSNILINWVLLIATIITTFFTGFFLSLDVINPYVGGIAFSIAILAVLGIHEMGHKITANRRGVDATQPYFIPAPPFPIGIGTFGAVIMQKSLPPNRDALFDVGADGPIAGFAVATVVSILGLTLSIPSPLVSTSPLGVPIIWNALGSLLDSLNLIPKAPVNGVLLLHPVAFAGWVGMLVTALNLLPVAMLDGGHIARSVLGEKTVPRVVLALLSIAYLLYEGFIPMAFLVIFMLFFKHPGPLDDVSSLSTSRKLAALGLVAIFVLCFVPFPSLF